jgi:ABC-type uncharacterized transport system permease subunit
VADVERPSTPLWWYAIVVIAIVLAGLWLLSAIIGFLFGLLKIAVVVVLAVALVGWIVGKKASR